MAGRVSLASLPANRDTLPAPPECLGQRRHRPSILPSAGCGSWGPTHRRLQGPTDVVPAIDPGFRPAQQLQRRQLDPPDLSRSSAASRVGRATCRTGPGRSLVPDEWAELSPLKPLPGPGPLDGECLWSLNPGERRGWDSNPRTLAGRRFSRPEPSTTRPPLHREPARRPARP